MQESTPLDSVDLEKLRELERHAGWGIYRARLRETAARSVQALVSIEPGDLAKAQGQITGMQQALALLPMLIEEAQRKKPATTCPR